MLILYGGRIAPSVIEGVENWLQKRNVDVKSVRRASKKGVAEAIREGIDGKDVDVVIMADFEMVSGNYSAAEYVYMRYRRDVKVIPILSPSMKGSPYLRILLENGIYTVSYQDETTPGQLATLILYGRNYTAAKLHYEV